MISSPGSLSDRQTSRSTNPSAPSTRCTRLRKARTSSSARFGATRRRERDTYTGVSISARRGHTRRRVDGIAVQVVDAERLREPCGCAGAGDRDGEVGGKREVVQRRVGPEVCDPPAVVVPQRQAEAQESDVVLLAGRAGEERGARSVLVPPGGIPVEPAS